MKQLFKNIRPTGEVAPRKGGELFPSPSSPVATFLRNPLRSAITPRAINLAHNCPRASFLDKTGHWIFEKDHPILKKLNWGILGSGAFYICAHIIVALVRGSI